MKKIHLIIGLSMMLFACQTATTEQGAEANPDTVVVAESLDTIPAIEDSQITEEPHDSAFVNLANQFEGFAYDMRYATDNNFLKKTVYQCTNCLVRYEVAKALKAANGQFFESGLRIKFYDCFRPVEVQKQMWEIMPDGRYVANPYKTGSVHNRGAAVDITLVDAEGKELDMGTDFDFFGEKAHHSYADLPQEVLDNRKLLKNTMESAGFQPIKTEWWHYNFGDSRKYLISDTPLCDAAE